MKAKRGEMERALGAPGGLRLFLLHGPDDAGSHALSRRLAASLGKDVERVPLSPSTLKADPALLADEAASLSLFGLRRMILIDGGGDDLVDAVSALLDAPAACNPAVIVTGTLKKTSKLLSLAESSPRALSHASYAPEGRDAERLVVELGRAAGLVITGDLARRLATDSGGDRALLGFEIDKYALYLDADVDRPVTLDLSVVDALSAGTEESDISTVVDAVLDGELRALDREVAQFATGGGEAVTTLRALARRLMLLIKLRGEVDGGRSTDGVLAAAGKSLFFRDKPAVARQLGRWPSDRLAIALTRTLEAERDLKAPEAVGADAVSETLFALARVAVRQP